MIFRTNTFVKVMNARKGDYAPDGAIGIVCRGSDEYITRVFLIRGPYWKADDSLMIELHSRRSGVYIPTNCLHYVDMELTADERSNLKKWWSAHGFEIE